MAEPAKNYSKNFHSHQEHHGGSWKVALADFMTAMMAFFLVMWLLGQSEETRKRIADYFSSPSLVEYYYQQFGALLTLEKLFQDFINAPLETLQKMFNSTPSYPNLWEFRDFRLISQFILNYTSDLLDSEEAITLDSSSLVLKIPDYKLFKNYSSDVTNQFLSQTEKLRHILAGLKDSEVMIEVRMFSLNSDENYKKFLRKVAIERLHKLYNRIHIFILEKV